MRELLERHRQLIVFLAGGGLSAVLDLGLMLALLLNGAALMPATSAGFALGLAFNYSFHVRVTFAAAPTRHTFMRYLCVVALNYLITLACVSAASAIAGLPLAGKIVALFIVPVNGFVLGKYWIFK